MIVALDEIPRAAEPCDPSLDWRPVRDHLGIRSFGVNAFLGAQPGDRVVERHTEDAGHEELYVVVRDEHAQPTDRPGDGIGRSTPRAPPTNAAKRN